MPAKHTRESLIKAIRRYAQPTAGRINVVHFCSTSRICPDTIALHFPGGFRAFLTAAGLEHRMCKIRRAGWESLMSELDRVAAIVGRPPTWENLRQHGRIRPLTYRRRFGPWDRVLAAHQRWKKERAPATQTAIAPATEPSAPAPVPPPAPPTGLPTPAVVGEPLGFRGLLHAPINEMGVVHLFGLLGPDLGIAVEHMGTAYPDCRGLRAEPGPGGRWRRVAIEFELKSSNFRLHNHDPAMCDLIVCWEHDWEGCPVEVLELRKEMEKVRERRAA